MRLPLLLFLLIHCPVSEGIDNREVCDEELKVFSRGEKERISSRSTDHVLVILADTSAWRCISRFYSKIGFVRKLTRVFYHLFLPFDLECFAYSIYNEWRFSCDWLGGLGGSESWRSRGNTERSLPRLR